MNGDDRRSAFILHFQRGSGQNIEKGGVPYEFSDPLPDHVGIVWRVVPCGKVYRPQADCSVRFFDYITGITIGSIAAEMATELEEPWKPLTAMVIYGGITLLLSVISNKFRVPASTSTARLPFLWITGSCTVKT